MTLVLYNHMYGHKEMRKVQHRRVPTAYNIYHVFHNELEELPAHRNEKCLRE